MTDIGDAVARVAELALAGGAMGNTLRRDDYELFLREAYGDGRVRTVATSCAVFAGACLIQSGAQAHRGVPIKRGITTWLGVHGFEGERSWISAAALEAQGGPRRGDVWYICSTRGQMGTYVWTTWPAAANGHVGICLDDGWLTHTAEGGGSPGGTTCRLSAAAKDIRTMGRTLRGVWRPSAMQPALPGLSLRTLRKGMSGTDVEKLQAQLGKIAADGRFGPQTEARVREFQQVHGLVADGIVGPQTWAKLLQDQD